MDSDDANHDDFLERLRERIQKKNHEGFAPGELNSGAMTSFPLLQTAFQIRYCPSCQHYDAQRGSYHKIGNSRDRHDCAYHRIDILGNCWDYRPRSDEPPCEHDEIADVQLLELLTQSLRFF